MKCEKPNHEHVHSQAIRGRAFWQREPAADFDTDQKTPPTRAGFRIRDAAQRQCTVTIPASTGSLLVSITTGTVLVASLTDGTMSPPSTTITSGFSAAISIARLRNRSGRPSAYRYSTVVPLPQWQD